MSNWRRKILLGALTGVVVTMLFPPFDAHPGGNKVLGLGFNLILNYGEQTGTVDISLLLTEWLAIAIVSGILWMLNRDPKAPGVIELALRIVERNAAAKIEVAKIRADAVIQAAEAQSQSHD